jgi:hypothetical protein
MLRPAIEEDNGGTITAIYPDGLIAVKHRFPVGARVRTTAKAAWKRAHGTVVETSDMPRYPHWPEAGPAAHMLSHDGAGICVQFDGDDGYSSWWPAYMVEPVTQPAAQQRPEPSPLLLIADY